MAQSITEVMNAALALPECERAELAELLFSTLDSPPASLHPAWSAEIRRRAAEVDAGESHPVSWAEVQRQIQAQLHSASSSDG